MSNILDEQMVTEVLETNVALDELVLKLNAVQSSLSGVKKSFENTAESMEMFTQHQIAFQDIAADLSAGYKQLERVMDTDCIENVVFSLTGIEKALQFDSIVDFTEKLGSSISTIHMFSGALGGNLTALKELQKNMPMVYHSYSTLLKGFLSFKNVFDANKSLKGFTNGIVDGFDAIQRGMTGIQKGLVGVSAVFLEFFAVKDSMYDMATGTKSVIAGFGEMAVAMTGAGVAFSMAFGAPVGVVLALGTAIAGIGVALAEVEAEKLGESIKNTLTNPGGVPIEELTNHTRSSIEQMGESFSFISAKANEFEMVESNIQDVTFEIEKMRTSIEAGVVSADEAIPHLIDLYGQLGDAISAKIGAAGDVLLATFAPGSISAQAFEYAGVSAESTRAEIVQSMSEQQKAVYDLAQELTHLQETDPTNPRIPELLAQIAAIEQGSSELTVSMGNLQVVASQGISWETYINDEGINLEAFNLELEGIINAGLNVKQSAERDFAATITAAESLGDPALVEKIQTGLPQALQYVDEQIATEAMAVANTMQTELVGNIENVVAEAEDRWSQMSWGEKLLSGFNSSDEYVQNAVVQYKTECIDPFSKNLEEQYAKLGIDGAGWADEASQKIINSMFDFNVDTNYGTGEITTSTILNDKWKNIIENSTNGIYDLMKEKGLDAVDGLNTGVNENAYLTGEEITNWMDENVTSVVQKELDSHSPSKVMEEFGMYSVLGYNQGIENYTPLTTIAMTAYMNKALSALGLMYGKMYLVGANTMLGIYDGLKSKENMLYAKAQTIADNIKNMISAAYNVEYEVNVPTIPYNDYEPYINTNSSVDLSSSITTKVEVAVTNAMLPFLEQIAQNTKEALNKSISVNIGDKEIARANIRGKSAMGMQLIK